MNVLGQAVFPPELESSISDVVERLAPTWRGAFDSRILGISWDELFSFIELPTIEFSEFSALGELPPLLAQEFPHCSSGSSVERQNFECLGLWSRVT